MTFTSMSSSRVNQLYLALLPLPHQSFHYDGAKCYGAIRQASIEPWQRFPGLVSQTGAETPLFGLVQNLKQLVNQHHGRAKLDNRSAARVDSLLPRQILATIAETFVPANDRLIRLRCRQLAVFQQHAELLVAHVAVHQARVVTGRLVATAASDDSFKKVRLCSFVRHVSECAALDKDNLVRQKLSGSLLHL